MVAFRDALANCQKTLWEWDKLWGAGGIFSHRGLKIPADCACGETLDKIQKGREALFQMEAIAFVVQSKLMSSEKTSG